MAIFYSYSSLPEGTSCTPIGILTHGILRPLPCHGLDGPVLVVPLEKERDNWFQAAPRKIEQHFQDVVD